MKTFLAPLQAALDSGSIGFLATCFKVTLLNGHVKAYSTWDDWLYSVDGTDYDPDTGVGMTEIDSNAIGTQVGTMKFTGLVGPSLTRADIRAFWPGATILVFNVVPKQRDDLTWTWDTTKGMEILRFGDLGNVQFPSDVDFLSEFRSLGQRASLQAGASTAILCSNRFGVDDGAEGASHCPVDITTKQHNVTILTVSADGLTITFTLAITVDFLTRGWIDPTSGANIGIQSVHIVKHTQSGSTATIVLEDNCPFPLVVSGTLRVTEGCQKRFDPDCIRHLPAGGGHSAGWAHRAFKDTSGPDFLALRVKP